MNEAPLYEAIDSALLDASRSDPLIARLAEFWQALSREQRDLLESKLSRHLADKRMNERVHTLADVLTYHHALALHYKQMADHFEKVGTSVMNLFTLADVNRLFSNHEMRRARHLMAVIRNKGQGDVSKVHVGTSPAASPDAEA